MKRSVTTSCQRKTPPWKSHFSSLPTTSQRQNPTTHYTPLQDFTIKCNSHDLHGAIAAMDTLNVLNLRADPLAYSSLIKSCIQNGDLETGRRVHLHLFHGGFIPPTFLINQVIGMYVRFKLVDEARKVFDVTPERNVVSWTTMISAYANIRWCRVALEFFVMMGRDGIMPNMYTLSSVLRASDGLGTVGMIYCLAIKCGLDSDVFVRSSLIDIYAKLGDLKSGLCVFSEMSTRDLVVWNSMIGGFAQDGNGHMALDL